MTHRAIPQRLILAAATSAAIVGGFQVAAAQQVPPLYDGRDATYQIMPGSNLRRGDGLTSGIVITLWQGGTLKGNGPCTQQSCPVAYNTQNLFARRSRLRLGTGGGTGGGAITETLRRGDQGENVRRLQEILNKSGATLTADGNYGRGTEAAVATFQRSKNLNDDGVAGPQTLKALGLS